MKGIAKSIWKDYYKELMNSIKDKSFRTGVERATVSYEIGITKLFNKYPESFDLAEKVRKIKEYAISHIDEMVKTATKSFENKGFHVHYAKTADEANKIIGDIVGSNKIIVKGKSITSEETRLREFLEEHNNEVWETDLGEFIIQLLGERPMHLVTPSLHVPKEQVADLFSKFFKKKYDPNDVQSLVKAASDFLRDKYFNADVSIVGANVIAAKEGAAILIHNEGNLRFVVTLPRKVIILAGIEKIVPDIESAMLTAYVTARFAKYKVAGYFDIFAGNEIIADGSSEKQQEVHVVFLDNGRTKIISDPEFREAAYCLRCGACMYSCPVFKVIAGKFGGSTYMGGIGTIWTYFIEGPERSVPALYSCLLDGRCLERCPVKINTPEMIKKLRTKINS
ncbi:MAG: LUD domain-containing protein [Candidatus Asgardarchaeia archaeon]